MVIVTNDGTLDFLTLLSLFSSFSLSCLFFLYVLPSLASFSLSRILTYSYLLSFNAWLLLAPVVLCYDWQVGSIPLVESLADVRNLATLLLAVVMVALCLSYVFSLQVRARTLLTADKKREASFTDLLYQDEGYINKYNYITLVWRCTYEGYMCTVCTISPV